VVLEQDGGGATAWGIDASGQYELVAYLNLPTQDAVLVMHPACMGCAVVSNYSYGCARRMQVVSVADVVWSLQWSWLASLFSTVILDDSQDLVHITSSTWCELRPGMNPTFPIPACFLSPRFGAHPTATLHMECFPLLRVLYYASSRYSGVLPMFIWSIISPMVQSKRVMRVTGPMISKLRWSAILESSVRAYASRFSCRDKNTLQRSHRTSAKWQPSLTASFHGCSALLNLSFRADLVQSCGPRSCYCACTLNNDLNSLHHTQSLSISTGSYITPSCPKMAPQWGELLSIFHPLFSEWKTFSRLTFWGSRSLSLLVAGTRRTQRWGLLLSAPV